MKSDNFARAVLAARDYLIPLPAIKPMTRFLLLLPLLANAFQLPTAFPHGPRRSRLRPRPFCGHARGSGLANLRSFREPRGGTVVPAAKGYEESLLIASDGRTLSKLLESSSFSLFCRWQRWARGSGIAKEIASIAGYCAGHENVSSSRGTRAAAVRRTRGGVWHVAHGHEHESLSL